MRYFAPTKISENMRETPEGFLICIGVPIARTGEMIYDRSEIPLEPDDTGKIKVMRLADQVFRPETIASFEGKPVCITHPTEDVTPENWKDLAKGEMVNVRKGEGEWADSLLADLLIKDKMAIGLVKSGLREVSCGYDADWMQEKPGTGWQENIYGNHLALVSQGRAGHDYRIADSKKGKAEDMKVIDKLKAHWAKANDDAQKIIDAATAEGQMSEPNSATGKPAEAKDAMAYDAMMKSMDAMKKTMDAIAEKLAGKKSGDEDPAEAVEETGGDETPAASMEDRLKACEEGLATLLEKMSMNAGNDEMEEEDNGEEVEDEDFEESTMVGDSAHDEVLARAEILSPGIAAGKNLEVRALKAAYGTKEGKKVIHMITGGRAPAFDSADKVKTMFRTAAEIMKVTRSKDLGRTKTSARDAGDPKSEPMTPEMINKKNADFYAKQSAH
jgi:uncharacterized protein